MDASEHAVEPIARGFAYALRVAVGGAALFPSGCALKAQLRNTPGSPIALASLSTQSGAITRVDDHTVDLQLPEAATTAIGNSTVVLDLVRTDVAPEAWLGIVVFLPVVQPVTAP